MLYKLLVPKYEIKAQIEIYEWLTYMSKNHYTFVDMIWYIVSVIYDHEWSVMASYELIRVRNEMVRMYHEPK